VVANGSRASWRRTAIRLTSPCSRGLRPATASSRAGRGAQRWPQSEQRSSTDVLGDDDPPRVQVDHLARALDRAAGQRGAAFRARAHAYGARVPAPPCGDASRLAPAICRAGVLLGFGGLDTRHAGGGAP
jgi:hypothetical protein